MKSVFFLQVIVSTALAGNGSGTMMGGSGSGTLFGNGGGTMASYKDIILYQGETKNDIYFKYGQRDQTSWKIQDYVIAKDKAGQNSFIQEALNQSKQKQDWSDVLSPVTNATTLNFK